MQKEESLGQRMAQSQQEFRKQFDPANPNYHKGLQVVVPTGGDRIPESMPTMYPQGYIPVQQPETADYGEEYRNVEANRNIYQNLKKQLAKLGPIVEAFLRHQQIFKQKGDPTNQKHIKTHEENVAKERVALKEVQTILSTYGPLLEQMDADGKQSAKELNQIIFESGKEYSNKETLGNFNFKCKKLSTKTFAMAQKYLQKLKDIKKDYANKQKLAAQKKQETA